MTVGVPNIQMKPVTSAPRLNLAHPLAQYVSFAVFGTEAGGLPMDIGPLGMEPSPGGTPEWADGVYGPEMDLEYSSAEYWLYGLNEDVISSTRPFTLATRFTLESYGNGFPTVAGFIFDNGGTSDEFLFLASNSSGYRPFSGGNAVAPVRINNTAVTLTLAEPHTIVLTYDGVSYTTQSSYSWYQNGVPYGSVTTSLNSSTPTNIIGAPNTASGSKFDGKIDYVIALDGYAATQHDVDNILSAPAVYNFLAPPVPVAPSFVAGAAPAGGLSLPLKPAFRRQPSVLLRM